MALAFDPSPYYRVWINTEPVTLTAVERAGDTNHAIAVALKAALTDREVEKSFGVYVGEDVHWNLPGHELDLAGAPAPKPRDRVTDGAGTVWTVLERTYDHTDRIYDCVCRDLVLVNGLRDAVTARRPAAGGQDAAGNRRPLFVPLAVAVPARVQETDRRETPGKLGKVVTEVHYSVWVGQTLYLTHEDQLLWTPAGEADERVLEVTGGVDPERIDALQRVDCRWRF